MQRARRDDYDNEVFESLASLLRQGASRAVQRARLCRQHLAAARGGDAGGYYNTNNNNNSNNMSSNNNNSHHQQQHIYSSYNSSTHNTTGSSAGGPRMTPMDYLLVQYCMYYLDVDALVPAHHYVRLAREAVTASPERLLSPGLFAACPSLPALVEGILRDYGPSDVAEAVAGAEALLEVRDRMGLWLAEAAEGRDGASGDDDDPEDDDFYDNNNNNNNDGGDGDRPLKRVKTEDGAAAAAAAAGNAADEDSELAGLAVDARHATYEGLLAERQRGGRRRRGGGGGVLTPGLALASVLHSSLEYWQRVLTLLNALTAGKADMVAVPLQPPYERRLTALLHRLVSVDGHASATSSKGSAAVNAGGAASGEAEAAEDPPVTGAVKAEEGGADAVDGATADPRVKTEPPDEADEVPPPPPQLLDTTTPDSNDAKSAANSTGNALSAEEEALADADRDERAAALLGDVLALSHVHDGNTTTTSAQTKQGKALLLQVPAAVAARLSHINSDYFRMVHARLGIMVARRRLQCFGAARRRPPPPLTASQAALEEQLRAGGDAYVRAMETFGGAAGDGGDGDGEGDATGGGDADAAAEEGAPGRPAALLELRGMPKDVVPDTEYFQQVLRRHGGSLGADEELLGAADMVARPRRRPPQAGSYTNGSSSGGNSAGEEAELVKPVYYGKVRKGYSWSSYNKIHYDRSNPPPQTILGYEFTVFYPLLADTRKDMSRIFRLENLPPSEQQRGPRDDGQEYCVLVFSPGPPYADLALRVLKRAWDRRRGGTRISFDADGTFKLSFRFAHSNFRR